MNAPAHIPAAQVHPAVQILQDSGGAAILFDAGSDEGRKECARFFSGLGLSPEQIAQNNRARAKERAMVAEARKAAATGGERAAVAVLMAAVCREMGVA